MSPVWRTACHTSPPECLCSGLTEIKDKACCTAHQRTGAPRTSSPSILKRKRPLRMASRLSQLCEWSPKTQPVGNVYTVVLKPWLFRCLHMLVFDSGPCFVWSHLLASTLFY